MTNPILLVKNAPIVVKRKREGIQLCKVYNPEKPPDWKSAVYERKLDGYRCIAKVVQGRAILLTSTGLPHFNIRHIENLLERAAAFDPELHDNIVLDGELIHSSLPFDRAGGILRQHEDHEDAKGFVLYAWDVLDLADFDKKVCSSTLIARKVRLRKIIKNLAQLSKALAKPKYVVELDFKLGKISDIVERAKKYVLEDGDEGIVAKDPAGMYEFRKSGTWLKWKPNFDSGEAVTMKEGDFRITGIQPGRGKHLGRVGALFLEGYLLEDGNISPDPPETEPLASPMQGKVGTGFDDADRIRFQEWFDNGTLIGKVVEIKYQELSSKGNVRFPVFYRLREDKD